MQPTGRKHFAGRLLRIHQQARHADKHRVTDESGLNFFSKRLEQGTFSWPKPAADTGEKWLQIQPTALTLLLDGIELKKCIKKV